MAGVGVSAPARGAGLPRVSGPALALLLATSWPVSQRPVAAAAVDYRPRASYQAHKGDVVGLAFREDGQKLVSVGRDGQAVLWDARSGSRSPLPLPAAARGVAASPTEDAFFVVDQDGRLHSYSFAGKQRFSIRAHKKAARGVAVSGNGAFVATGGDDGKVRLWEAATGTRVAELAGHSDDVLAVVFEPGNSPRLFSFEEKSWFVWDVNTRESLGSQQPAQDPVKGRFHILSAGAGPGWLAIGGQYVYPRKGYQGLIFEDEIHLYRLSDNRREHVIGSRDRSELRGLAITPDGRYLAAAAESSRALLWEASKEEEVFSLALEGKGRSVAVSGDGRLLAAGDSDGKVTIVELSGVGAAPETVPPEEAASPIIIVIIEPTIIVSRRLGRPDVAVPEPPDGAPPPPGEAARFTSRSLRVRGKVTSGKALQTLQVNGQDITSIRSRGSDQYEFSTTVPLDVPGERPVEVVARNAAGTVAAKTFLVNRAERVEAPSGTPGRRIALIVGISRYRDPGINLKYAEADARAIHDLLTSPELGASAFREEDVKLLCNEEATNLEIQSGLKEFLPRARAEDFVLFYFAGHGSPDPRDLRKTYLLAHDTDPNRIAATGLLMTDVRRWLSELEARDVVVLADACHSAGLASVEGMRKALSVNPINDAFLEKMTHSSGGFAILTASEKAQTSAESDRWGGHGVFTHFLLKGFRGGADRNDDHIVTVGELMEYVRDGVRNETDFAQIPAIGPTSYDRELPLVISSDR